MKHKKVLSWVVTLTLLFSLSGGMQTVWADVPEPTISADKTTLENGVLPQTIVITLENATFSTGFGSSLYSSDDTAGPKVRSYRCVRDSDTQLTVTINETDMNNLRAGSITFYVYNLSGGTSSNTLTFTIPAATALMLNESTLGTIKKDDYYSHKLSVSGGNGSKTFRLESGSLPDGLSLDADGELRGNPTTVGNYSFTVSATDSSATPVTVSGSYSISVDGPALSSDGNYMVMNGIIYSYKGSETDVTIPSEIDGVTITEIEDEAFKNTNVKNVIIPSSVTTIGDMVFKDCGSLKSVVLPNSITSMGYSVFFHSSIENVNIPTGIHEIPGSSFAYCLNLAHITIPDNIESLEFGAFRGCLALKSVTIPESISKIGDYAFCQDDAYDTHVVPKLMLVIFKGDAPVMGSGVFYYTPLELKICYPNNKTGYSAKWNDCDRDCVGYNPGASYIVDYNANGGTGSVIPSSVTGINLGDEVVVAANTLTKEGQSFTGWNTKADGTGTGYAPGKSLMVVNDITLYAQWKAVDTGTGSGSGSNHHNGGGNRSATPVTGTPTTPATPTTDDQKNGSTGGFGDTEHHWAKESVTYVTEKGLFGGTGNGQFSPDLSMNRGMLVTVLGRIWSQNNGSLDVENAATFGDVNADAYYSNYVKWAAANGIATGVGNGEFAPGTPITREQLVSMIYNYAKYAGIDVTDASGSTIEGYGDSDQISDWAATAMAWAVHKGLLSGKGNGSLDPKGTATRAEVAKIIEAFMQQAK